MAKPENYEIKIGVDGEHWFVAVRPPLSRDDLGRMGRRVMSGWAIEQLEPTTVFRKRTNASLETADHAVHDDEDGLAQELLRIGEPGSSVFAKDWTFPIVMSGAGVTSPFDVKEKPSIF